MDDILSCPICGNKLRNISKTNKTIHYVAKTANYTERVCASGHNHVLMIFVDDTTKHVDFLRMSLNSKYSRFIEIDFINKKCRISCMKDNKPEYIQIPKMIEPDFPLLLKLKEKVSLFITFS